MQSKQVLLLGVITAAVVAGAVIVLKQSDGASSAQSATSQRGALLPEFGEQINAATSVAITRGGETITLQRDVSEGSTWGVAERGGYPANFGTVRELLVALKDLEIEAPKTAKPANYSKLGVEDVTADSASASLVVKAGESELANLILGTSTPGGGDASVYVRRGGEAQSWQARGPELTLKTAPIDWMEREIMRIEPERVRSALIQHADGEQVKLQRAARDSNTFVVANLPPGRIEKNEGIGNAVATALSYFSMEDVQPLSAVDFTVDPRAITTIVCYDGLVLDVATAKVGELTWAKVACSFVAPTETAASTQGDAEPATLITSVDVDMLNAKVARWAFQVQDFKADALARRMDELLANEAPAEGDVPALPMDVPAGLPPGFDLDSLIPGGK